MRFCAVILTLLLIAARVYPEPATVLSAQEIFDRVRARVKEQLTHSRNYSCVETVERTYSIGQGARADGCELRANVHSQKLFMRDRLRLDVADSDGAEIFSWYGGKRFSSRGIDDVVKTGPISSGSFVGYLHNVFFQAGVHIRYWRSQRFPDHLYHFEFDVPLSASAQIISTASGRGIAPFTGTFSADPATFDLVELTVAIDSPPRKTKLCSSHSSVEYQNASISGVPSRVPKSFTLEMDDSTHTYTVSRSDFSQCKAFTGESTISFNMDGVSSVVSHAAVHEEELPAGVTLPIRLLSTVDEMHSFTGDLVEGVLDHEVKLPHKKGVIEKGALVTGFVSRLESRFVPSDHTVVGIRFNRLSDAAHSYVFDAISAPSRPSLDRLNGIYGTPLPASLRPSMTSGVFVFGGKHAQVNSGFAADWQTISEKHDHEP